MKGTIAGKNEEKGFGFITPDGMENAKENNVFFHTSSLEGVTFEELAIGAAVEFDKEDSEKGPRAAHVKLAA
ncbi:MAG: cold shock domain-containing protein [bacterium]|nr:cold shock domain-containing protein [bacterium]